MTMAIGSTLFALRVIAVSVALGTSSVSAATVRALPLPAGFTVEPEADRRVMSVSADGTVYAITHPIGEYDARALVWRNDGEPQFFSPVPDPSDSVRGPAAQIDAVVPASDAPYITVGRSFSGAYSGVNFSIDRWLDRGARAWVPPTCANVGRGSPHIFAVDADRIAMTIDLSSNTPAIDLSDAASVRAVLPRAVLVTHDTCTSFGTALLTAVRGDTVVGYRGFLDGNLASWFVNLMVQRMFVTRWTHGHESNLGPGVPYATTSRGLVVGATALPGHAAESVTTNFFGKPGTYTFATPHAALWLPTGKQRRLFRADVRSVAWDVNEAGIVVGMVQGADGKHRAFRFENGRVQLLDDLPHPSGWRFESAEAIEADGSIVGIGTYNDVATAFVIH